MKETILELMICPSCRERLRIREAAREGGEITSGALDCGQCGASFPIVGSIPRFVPTDSYVDTFSFEWNTFHDVQIDILNKTDVSESTLKAKTGWRPEDLAGKRVLDIGVGAGRFADVVSRWGGEVVGVDLSRAVDAAHRSIGRRENVHIVQADLFRLPFREGVFDNIYSMGVLHHTPDTREAFKAIVPYLKKGGEIAIFVYGYGMYHYFSDRWRRVTTKLPIRLLYGLSGIAIPLYYIHRIPLVGKATQMILPISMEPRWKWRWLDTFDWYSPKYQWKHTWPEVYGWFQEEGLTGMELLAESRGDSLGMVCIRGRKE